MKKADEACRLMHDNKYKQDMWMWDQDWSIQNLKLKKQPNKGTSKKSENSSNSVETKTVNSEVVVKDFSKSENMVAPHILNAIDKHEDLTTKFSHLFKLKNLLYKVRPLLPGYPAWYRKLCDKLKKNEKWSPGPINITTSMQVNVCATFVILHFLVVYKNQFQVTPKLLQLTWEGYPLHYIRGEGWGFLVPFEHKLPDIENTSPIVPLEKLVNSCPVVTYEPKIASQTQSMGVLNNLWKDVEVMINKIFVY